MFVAAVNEFAYRFPKAHRKAVVMSYDDGSEHDRRFVDIFNTDGLRGTFHLNSSRLGDDCHIIRDEVGTLYRGHEVSCDGRHHLELTALADHDALMEIGTDKDWTYMEGVCRRLHASSAVWFATMVEVADYLEALRLVDASRSDAGLCNPSALPVWLRIDGRDVELPPGAAVDSTGTVVNPDADSAV